MPEIDLIKIKEELKDYIMEFAFDGWKDTTDDNVLSAIDEFFSEYEKDSKETV